MLLRASPTGTSDFSRRDDDTVVQHPQASRDALASWAQHQAARMAPMYELTLLPPAVLTLVSVTRIPATKVTQVSRWSKLGRDRRRHRSLLHHRSVRNSRRKSFYIDLDPLGHSPFGSRHAREKIQRGATVVVFAPAFPTRCGCHAK